MEPVVEYLSEDGLFAFECHDKVPCFNACCGNLTQALAPYDILRLKNSLQIESGLFLERYTSIHTGPVTGLPIVSLKFRDSSDGRCPFVGPQGCSVYSDRPASCRIYPLARGAGLDDRGRTIERWALIKEHHCQGHNSGKLQSVKQWISDQDLEDYLHFNDMMLEIISLQNKAGCRPLTGSVRQRFITALYDLDGFSRCIGRPGWQLGPEFRDRLEEAVRSQAALLELALDWIKMEMGGIGYES